MERDKRHVWFGLLGVGLIVTLLAAAVWQRPESARAEEGGFFAFLPAIFGPEEELEPTPTATTEMTATVETTITATAEATASPEVTTTSEPSETPSSTPTATATEQPSSTPTSTAMASGTPSVTPDGTAVPGATLYLPVIAGPPAAALDVPIAVAKQPPIDFAAERAAVRALGYDLAFNKIGFHVLQGQNRQGLSDYIQALDAAGVPAVLKGASDAQYLFEAQELGKKSGVDHVLVYRDAAKVGDPDYSLDPVTAARLNWQQNRAVFPPELDPSIVWMETVNEPREKPEEWVAWLASFALEQAKLAVAEGVRYAAFSWTSGAPPGTATDPDANWDTPEMIAFLQYAAQHPDLIAVALHEYSFTSSGAGIGYPLLVGRFQDLFSFTDAHNIPRPTVFITEWGWEYNDAPSIGDAMDDIAWAAWLYAAYPQVKGVALWTLGEGEQFGSIGDTVQTYLEPMTDYSLSNYFIYSPGTRPVDKDSLAPGQPPVTPTPTATPDPNVTPTVTATPTVAPTADPVSPLRNGSFEDGWETIEFGNQRPNSWQISWVQPGAPLYDSSDLATGVCECVHKLKNQLPPSEWPDGTDPLILEGEVTYKAFSASQAFGTQLSQQINGLPAGVDYRLTVPLRMHQYGEVDPFGAEAGVWVNNVGDWSNVEDMTDRQWCKHELVFEVPEDGQITIDVRVKSKYPSTKDFFMDDWRLAPASSPAPHSDMPLCDPTPELDHYRPYRVTSWWFGR